MTIATVTDLTTNERKALEAVYRDCLYGMGGKNADDLIADPHTWTDVDVLIAAGWSRHEAAGTFGALMDKGLIDDTGEGLALADDAIEVCRAFDA